MLTALKSTSQALDTLRQAIKEVPSAAIVLGSGVKVLEDLSDQISLPYDQVFGIAPSIVGHAGTITLGRIKNRLVAVFRGRFHLYEGYDWDAVTVLARVIAEWGVPHLYVTNAAGGMNPSFRVGDLMLITGYRDHLNPKWKELGLLPAIAAPNQSCENQLTKHLWETSQNLAKTDSQFRPMQKGVYMGLLGPTYETLAEIEMLKRLNGDAVGMSTIPELKTIAETKTQIAGISVISNVWESDTAIGGHEEVLRATKEASVRLDKLLKAAICS